MFDSGVLAKAREHARLCYPEESCGIVFKDQYIPMNNMAEKPQDEFRIDPIAYARFVLVGNIQAIVHSHPKGPNCPTKLDMEGQIATAVPWVIVPMVQGAAQPPFWWGDQCPVPPLLEREFRMGVADCYTLARDWYRLSWGLVLPVWPRDPDWWVKGQSVIFDGLSEMGFVKVDENDLQPGDGVIMKIWGHVENHVAVYEGNGAIIHHKQKRLSNREPLGPWRHSHVTRIMRHRSRIND